MVKAKNVQNKRHYSVAEAAALLGISRIAVFKKIKSGKLKASKVGRNYVIRASAVRELAGGELTGRQRSQLEKGVSRVLKEYGETLRLLGKE